MYTVPIVFAERQGTIPNSYPTFLKPNLHQGRVEEKEMTGNKSSKNKELIAKDNFSEWYDNVLLEAKIADDRYPVKGFTVYTGWGMSIARRIIAMLEEKLCPNGDNF